VLFEQLIDDAAMFPPGNAAPEDAVADHRSYRRSWFSRLIGPLVVSDQKLAETGRAFLRQAQAPDAADGLVEVSVVNTSGAGGLVSLGRRSAAGLSVVAVESALRDLDDLAGNAARVAAAAAELDESVTVFVEIPFGPGWERAVEEIEAAGLSGKIRTGGVQPADYPTGAQLARQLSVLIEADLPFKATAGLHRGWPNQGTNGAGETLIQHGFLNLLIAVDALIDGASAADAEALLAVIEPNALGQRISGWSESQSSRVRRRFRSFGCCGVLDPIHDLSSLGLIREAE
jgi:hypothetical protein